MLSKKVLEPIFILAGQSNLAGRADISEIPAHFHPRALNNDVDYRFNWSNDHNFGGEPCSSNGEFRPLQSQLSPGLNYMQLFGPEMALAHTLQPRLKVLGIKRAYFIKFAMGSTNLHTNWNPSNTVSWGKMSEIGYYGTFSKFCQDSLARLVGGSENDIESSNRRLCGMFWFQGESDSSKAKDANAYLANFKHFTTTFREDLGCPDLPIVVSPVLWHGKKVKVINEALKQAADSEVPHCVCVDPLDEQVFGVQGDDVGLCAGHLTAAGLCEVGRRMGEAVPFAGLEDTC